MNKKKLFFSQRTNLFLDSRWFLFDIVESTERFVFSNCRFDFPTLIFSLDIHRTKKWIFPFLSSEKKTNLLFQCFTFVSFRCQKRLKFTNSNVMIRSFPFEFTLRFTICFFQLKFAKEKRISLKKKTKIDVSRTSLISCSFFSFTMIFSAFASSNDFFNSSFWF